MTVQIVYLFYANMCIWYIWQGCKNLIHVLNKSGGYNNDNNIFVFCGDYTG